MPEQVFATMVLTRSDPRAAETAGGLTEPCEEGPMATKRTGPRPTPPHKRVLNRVRVEGECWIFTGFLNDSGYGQIRVGSLSDGSRRSALAHRIVYASIIGEPLAGFHLHHSCERPACVNPNHLVEVDVGTHTRLHAGSSTPHTHCCRGHEFDEANTVYSGGDRVCRTCRSERRTARYWRNKARRVEQIKGNLTQLIPAIKGGPRFRGLVRCLCQQMIKPADVARHLNDGECPSLRSTPGGCP